MFGSGAKYNETERSIVFGRRADDNDTEWNRLFGSGAERRITNQSYAENLEAEQSKEEDKELERSGG